MLLDVNEPPVTAVTSGTGVPRRPAPLSEPGAWERLVDEHHDHLLRVASSYRIGPEAHDVVQTAWLRLLEQSASIRDWDAVRAWLTTVVRRECVRILRSRQRENLYGQDDFERIADVVEDSAPPVDERLVREESQRLVHRAMQSLPRRQQDLLNALSEADAPQYAVVGARLGMPVGSMGPTRQRGLRRLRVILTDMGVEMAN